MTPEMRAAARELLAGLWGAVWIYLRAALDQIDADEKEIVRLREAFRAAIFCPKGTIPKGFEDLWDGAWTG